MIRKTARCIHLKEYKVLPYLYRSILIDIEIEEEAEFIDVNRINQLKQRADEVKQKIDTFEHGLSKLSAKEVIIFNGYTSGKSLEEVSAEVKLSKGVTSTKFKKIYEKLKPYMI